MKAFNAINGFLMTQIQMTLKLEDECGYIVLVNFIGHVDTTSSSRVVHLRFCGALCIARSVSQPR